MLLEQVSRERIRSLRAKPVLAPSPLHLRAMVGTVVWPYPRRADDVQRWAGVIPKTSPAYPVAVVCVTPFKLDAIGCVVALALVVGAITVVPVWKWALAPATDSTQVTR